MTDYTRHEKWFEKLSLSNQILKTFNFEKARREYYLRGKFQSNYRSKFVSPRKHNFPEWNFNDICVWKWKLSG